MIETNHNAWHTAITEIKPNHIRVRGYDIAELMGNVSVGQAVYLILRGELPEEKIGNLMEAILISSIDHGATPPSVMAARTVASTGASLIESVTAGIMSINKLHGGAIQDCAIQLARIIDRAERQGTSLLDAAKHELVEMKARGERMSGFGHRFHDADPRTTRLLELADQAGVKGCYLDAAEAVRQAFEQLGKPLPMNIDGTIGVVLAQLGFPPSVMNGLFMIARTPGLVAHVVEDQHREKPMRKIDPVNHDYDGPAARSLKGDSHALPR